LAEWEENTEVVLNYITVISLLVVLFPSQICPTTAKNVIDYSKYVLGTTLLISFEDKLFKLLETVLNPVNLIELGQQIGTIARTTGQIAISVGTAGHGLAVRAYELGGNAAAKIHSLTHEIIRRLISETPEHITGQEDLDIDALSDAYVANFYRILDDDNAAREEIMRLEQEYGVMDGTGADWDAMSGAPTSAANSQELGPAIYGEAQEQWEQGPGGLIDSQLTQESYEPVSKKSVQVAVNADKLKNKSSPSATKQKV